MKSPSMITTKTFLSVCPADRAVDWLAERRKQKGRRALWEEENDLYETVLLNRHDAYIDFGIAQYGMGVSVAKQLYSRGDEPLRCVILANAPNGGCDIAGRYAIAEPRQDRLPELHALMSNSDLPDNVLEDCFSRKGVFGKLSENEYRELIIEIGKNSRLSRPYDREWMDGWAEYSYHNVFTTAWELTNVVPATEPWAYALYTLLGQAQAPSNFDPKPVMKRWQVDPPLKANERHPYRSYSFRLRSRLADLVEADDVLLKTDDAAARHSFYRRFSSRSYPDWASFYERDGEEFLDQVRENEALWRSEPDRERLRELHWKHSTPDLPNDLLTANLFESAQRRMQREHPDWFKDELEHTALEIEAGKIKEALRAIEKQVVATGAALKWLLYAAIAGIAILIFKSALGS